MPLRGIKLSGVQYIFGLASQIFTLELEIGIQ